VRGVNSIRHCGGMFVGMLLFEVGVLRLEMLVWEAFSKEPRVVRHSRSSDILCMASGHGVSPGFKLMFSRCFILRSIYAVAGHSSFLREGKATVH
jgi:hypothetical protein